MSQRASGYERRESDSYPTPVWVTRFGLAPHIPTRIVDVWEPACGDGRMARELKRLGYNVHATDIVGGIDFLQSRHICDAIISNPPYGRQNSLAVAFIEHALDVVRRRRGFIAMLCSVDLDSGKTRRHLFDACPQWSKKIILTERIEFFPGERSSSTNHAWYCFDWRHEGPPTIAYEGGRDWRQQTKRTADG
jgi:hypothetical protein